MSSGVMQLLVASSLLSLPVSVEGILVGHVVDVLLDVSGRQVFGLEVRCGDGEHRFLPLAAARVTEREVVGRTSLALLDAPELAFYARKGTTLRSLRRDGRPVDDVELAESGVIRQVHGASDHAWRPVAV